MMPHTDLLDRPAGTGAVALASEPPLRLSLTRRGPERARPSAGATQEGASSQLEPEGSLPSTGPQPSWTIDRVIDERAIRAVFQPIVHLETKSVVGFEALSRGPEGSGLESPMALLQAAKDAGRLGELDWLCRVTAMQAAAASGLPPSLAWFINVEPAGLHTPCPEYLLPEFAQASSNLRVMFEFVERDIEDNLTTLLDAAADVRDNSWGVALDDVGAVAGSLAVLPMVQPDVVKLDRCLLEPGDPDGVTQVVTAVHAYAEVHGASVLAEGIETEMQEHIARAFGAEFGQGFRYGRPGPLPASLPVPVHVVPIRQQVSPVNDETAFDSLSTQHTVRHAVESEVAYIGAWLERQARTPGQPGFALASFEDVDWAVTRERRTVRRVFDDDDLMLITCGDAVTTVDPEPRRTKVRAANPVAGEWVFILLRPHFAAAFAARNGTGRAVGGDRGFEYVLTHDRETVITAARGLLQRRDHRSAAHWLARSEAPTGVAAPRASATTAEIVEPHRPARSTGSRRRSRLVRFGSR